MVFWKMASFSDVIEREHWLTGKDMYFSKFQLYF